MPRAGKRSLPSGPKCDVYDSTIKAPLSDGLIHLPHKIRILVVDPDWNFRQEIVRLLGREQKFACSGELGDVSSALAAVASLKPDLLLIDLHAGDSKDRSILSLLAFEHRSLPILILSAEQESLYAEQALQVGARGYLMKSELSAELVPAIHALLQGKIYLSHDMSVRLVKQFLQGGSTTGLGPNPGANLESS